MISISMASVCAAMDISWCAEIDADQEYLSVRITIRFVYRTKCVSTKFTVDARRCQIGRALFEFDSALLD